MNGTTQMMHVEASDDGLGAACSIAGSAHPSTHHTAPKPTMTSRANATSRRMRRDSSTGQFIYCHGTAIEALRPVLSLLREPASVCGRCSWHAPQSAGRPQAAGRVAARFGLPQTRTDHRWPPGCGAQSSNVSSANSAIARIKRIVAVKSQRGGGCSSSITRDASPTDRREAVCSSADVSHAHTACRSRRECRTATCPART